MCGVAGFFGLHGAQGTVERLRSMVEAMVHRGPNDAGWYVQGNIGLGMRRLSIIDVAGGKQPICNEDQSVWVVFNGEIYNYLELRQRLESLGHVFRSNSDTEVIVHSYEQWDINCVQELRGMFSVALWDDARQRLMLARDRLGIKPLYYWTNDRWLVFGSEIKSLLRWPELQIRPNRTALFRYLTYRFSPDDKTAFAGIYKLLPGHMLLAEKGRITTRRFWNIDTALADVSEPRCWTEEEAAERIRILLSDCVASHLMSEVPLGAFLSGGLDSTTLVLLMSRHINQPVKTYSVGFEGPNGLNELEHARRIARALETDHHELICREPTYDEFYKMLAHLEEPVVDPAVVPTYYVSRLAARDVTVVLTGEGSDETNGGYAKYRAALDSERWPDSLLKAVPVSLRRRSVELLARQVGHMSRRLERRVAWSLGASGEIAYTDTELKWKAKAFNLFSKDLLQEVARSGNGFCSPSNGHSYEQTYFLSDLKGWLPHDLLTKVDRMTMAHSLEARVPYLDHRYVEFALSLPWQMKLKHGDTKHLLRRAMQDLVPAEIRSRRQHGFVLPLRHWFENGWRTLAKDLLDPGTMNQRGYFKPESVKNIRNRLLQGDESVVMLAYALMTVELWHRSFVDRASEWKK